MCCNNHGCKNKTKKICYKIKKAFCSKTWVRSGTCTSKFCCRMNKKTKKYNCKATGRRVCFYKPKKVVLKCKYTFKHSKGVVCKRKICCGVKGCKLTNDKEVCEKVEKDFCHWSFTRKGACRRKYCCTKNDKGKMKCSHKGKTICRKIVSHVESLRQQLAKKYFALKLKIFGIKKSISQFNIKYWNQRKKCQRKLLKSKTITIEQKKIIKKEIQILKKIKKTSSYS